MREVINTCIFVSKPGVKRPNLRYGCRSEDNTTIHLTAIVCEVVGWMEYIIHIYIYNTYINTCIFVSKPGVKRTNLKYGCRSEDNTTIHLTVIVCEVVGWIELGQDRTKWWALTNMALNNRVP
jgi:hypothetical protein